MILRFTLIVLLAHSAACHRSDAEDKETRNQPSSPDDWEETVEPQLAPPPEVAIEIRDLTGPPPELKAYQRKVARTRPLPLRARRLSFGDSPSVDSNVVVSTGAGDTLLWHLVNAATGKVLVRFGASYIGSRKGKVAVVARRASDRQALLHMTDGRIVEPEAQLPNGEAATDWRILADETSPTVWLFAQDSSGNNYHGEWTNTEAPAVPVTAFPLWPKSATGRGGILAWDEEFTGECARFELRSGHAPLCRPGAIMYGGSEVLGEHWTLEGRRRPQLRRDDLGKALSVSDDCDARVLDTRQIPPRVLSMCSKGNDRRHFTLWSPERRWTWSGLLEMDATYGGNDHKPVLAVERIGKSEAPVSQWLDLERGILWNTEPMMPIAFSGSFGFSRKVLAQPAERLNELWLLDLEDGSIDVLSSSVDCDGEVQQDDITDDQVLVTCLSAKGLPHKFSRRRIQFYTWSEVIKFKTRTRWRTKKAFQGNFTESGIPVAIIRGRQAQLAELLVDE